jgi:penicillin-binding protein 2A
MNAMKKKFKVNWKRVSIAAVGFVLVMCIVLIGFMGVILAQNYHIDESKLQNMLQTTTIYDKDGQEVTKLYKENREYVPLEQMPPLVKEAFIAVEDQRFYEHRGIDPRAIAARNELVEERM